jgi:hypothetical protein
MAPPNIVVIPACHPLFPLGGINVLLKEGAEGH